MRLPLSPPLIHIKKIMKIRVFKHCTEERTNRFWREGIHEVDDATGMRVISQGKAALADGSEPQSDGSPMVTPGQGEGNQSSGQESGEKTETTVTATPLPEGFPAANKLISAGIDTVEKLKASKREDIEKVPEITKAEVIKIGVAVDKL